MFRSYGANNWIGPGAMVKIKVCLADENSLFSPHTESKCPQEENNACCGNEKKKFADKEKK